MTANEAKEALATLYDIKDIMAVVPHRPPFLLVDRVVALEPWKSLSAYKNVTIGEDFFRGHFPGTPVMPGVLVLEAMAQAAMLLLNFSFLDHRDLAPPDIRERIAGKEKEGGGEGDLGVRIAYFASCDRVKFRRPVVPGDRLDLEASFVRSGGRLWKVAGRARVQGQRTAEAEMTATF
ncbi:MAG: beta-hydroxyacyl-ACP dehydratase [Deltaproteobacteria bacterium]|jgi:3-hydroxyacyl-[acyl-carrier-protein] dehydratase|nr:beta-hydroxyacyl-ACP dehydratase [Deltaproteobacteria bacterium]